MAKLTLFEKVKAQLKLGDEGKLNSFFERQKKALKRQIEGIEHNIQSEVKTTEFAVSKLEDQLVDAKEAVENAYKAIAPEDVATNEKQDAFATVYWGKIERAVERVESIEESIELTKSTSADRIEALELQKSELQHRLNVIEGEE